MRQTGPERRRSYGGAWSQAQKDRQHRRERNGRYESFKCQACGKSAQMDYFSHPEDGGYGDLLVLCGRPRCKGTKAMNMPVDAALDYVFGKSHAQD